MKLNSIIQEIEDNFNGEILNFIEKSGNISLGEFEEKILKKLLNLGKLLLKGKCAEREQDVYPESIIVEEKKLPRFGCRKRCYFSIFGKIEIERSCYWTKGHGLVFPLDKELCLPERVYSYPLQKLVSFIYAGCTL